MMPSLTLGGAVSRLSIMYWPTARVRTFHEAAVALTCARVRQSKNLGIATALSSASTTMTAISSMSVKARDVRAVDMRMGSSACGEGRSGRTPHWGICWAGWALQTA